jgi:hypothetical protein
MGGWSRRAYETQFRCLVCRCFSSRLGSAASSPRHHTADTRIRSRSAVHNWAAGEGVDECYPGAYRTSRGVNFTQIAEVAPPYLINCKMCMGGKKTIDEKPGDAICGYNFFKPLLVPIADGHFIDLSIYPERNCRAYLHGRNRTGLD